MFKDILYPKEFLEAVATLRTADDLNEIALEKIKSKFLSSFLVISIGGVAITVLGAHIGYVFLFLSPLWARFDNYNRYKKQIAPVTFGQKRNLKIVRVYTYAIGFVQIVLETENGTVKTVPMRELSGRKELKRGGYEDVYISDANRWCVPDISELKQTYCLSKTRSVAI